MMMICLIAFHNSTVIFLFPSKIKVLVLSYCVYTPVNGAAVPDLTVFK